MEMSQALVLDPEAVHCAVQTALLLSQQPGELQEEADVEPVGHAVISVHCSRMIPLLTL